MLRYRSTIVKYRSLIKKPWAFIRICIRVLNLNPNMLGLQGQGFLIRLLYYTCTEPRAYSIWGLLGFVV